MRTAVAALSSLEESLFAARSVLNHAKDISETLSLANAQLTPALIRPPRCRLVPAYSIARAKNLTQAQHEEYLELIVSEAYNQVETLGELIQDHRERLDYHLFLIQERFQSAKAEIKQKYQNEIQNLEQMIHTKKAELNRLYDLKENSASSDLRIRLDDAKEELKEFRLRSAERDCLIQQIQQQKMQLEQVRDGNAKKLEACRLQLRDLQKRIERCSACIDQDSIVKQITAILRACGASNHSVRAMKRITANGFGCSVADFDAEFPVTSESAQLALKSTLTELQNLGLIHITRDGIIAVGQLISKSD